MSQSAAIVGAGLMGRWHAHTARRLGVNVKAIVDTDAERRHELALSSGAAHECGDLAELFSTCRVDAVHICTPLPTHSGLCRIALDAGANVLCEKPLAGSCGEVDALLSHARNEERRLWAVHQFPWQPGAEKALRSLDRIGRLVRADFVFCSAGGEGRDDASLDDIVADILPHPLSILASSAFAFDLPGLQWTVTRDRAGEWTATTEGNGCRISILISLAIRPTECAMVLRGDQGSWHVDFYHGYSWLEPGAVSRYRKIIAPFRRGYSLLSKAGTNIFARTMRRQFAYPGLDRLMQAFYSRPLGEQESHEFQQFSDVAAARDAIIQDALRSELPTSGGRGG